MKFFAFLIALLPTFVAFCPEGDTVLENSLRSIFSSDFGYALVGAKPVSLDDSYDWYLDFYPELQRPVMLFLINTFKNSDNYIFRIRWYGRELINKESLMLQIASSTKLRLFVKQKFGNEEKFLDTIQNSSTGVFDLLDRNDVLIGIALGYGEENAEFYQRRSLVGQYLKKYPLFSVYPFQGKPSPWKIKNLSKKFRFPDVVTQPSISHDFASLECEWRWIQMAENTEVLRKDPMLREPYYLYLPRYISRKGTQSDQVHEKFVHARDKIARLFCGQKISKVIAEQAIRK